MWNANDMCMRFKGRMTALEFVEEWEAWQQGDGDSNANEESSIPPAKKICSRPAEDSDEKWMDDIDYDIEKHRVG